MEYGVWSMKLVGLVGLAGWGAKVLSQKSKVKSQKSKVKRKKEKIGHTGARTQDHSVISTALYRLSYTT